MKKASKISLNLGGLKLGANTAEKKEDGCDDNLMGENLKVVWAEFSTLSHSVLFNSNTSMARPLLD